MNRRGVTLFETVVSLIVVSLVASSALASVSSQMQAAERARRAMETQALASSRLDFIALMTDAELQSVPDSVENGRFEAPMDEYSWKMTAAPQEQAGVYAIELQILWPDNAYLVRTFAYRRPPVITAQ